MPLSLPVHQDSSGNRPLSKSCKNSDNSKAIMSLWGTAVHGFLSRPQKAEAGESLCVQGHPVLHSSRLCQKKEQETLPPALVYMGSSHPQPHTGTYSSADEGFLGSVGTSRRWGLGTGPERLFWVPSSYSHLFLGPQDVCRLCCMLQPRKRSSQGQCRTFFKHGFWNLEFAAGS